MNKPSKAYPDFDKGTSTLIFKGEEDSPREFYMLGGICWPMQYQLTDKPPDVLGYAIMAGQEVDTGIVHIFEQRQFVTIEHIFNSKGMVAYEGLSPWFNDMWSKYYCNKFYFNQPDELSKKHRLDVFRSQIITSRPQMIEVPMPDDKDALHTVWRYVKLKKFIVERDTMLAEHLALTGYEDKATPPIHALACLLVGLDRFPYRRNV